MSRDDVKHLKNLHYSPPSSAASKDDRNIINGLKSRDEAAYSWLLENFGAYVIWRCQSTLNRAIGMGRNPAVSAADGLQEALLRLIERIDAIEFEATPQVGKWLAVTAVNYCCDQIRKTRPNDHHSDSGEQIEENDKEDSNITWCPDDSDAWGFRNDNETLSRIRAIPELNGLTHEEVRLLFLRFVMEMTSEEIGSAMGVPSSRIRKQQSRLIQRIRSHSRVADAT